jgi:hypothetical protein
VKTFRFFIGVVSFALIASGQTSAAPLVSVDTIQRTSATTTQFRGHVHFEVFGTIITADGAEADLTAQPNRIQFRGHVQIESAGTIIKADEADVIGGPNGVLEFDVRGNVHVTVQSSR